MNGLMRDVGVNVAANVIANLAAVSVVYLVGATTGIFPAVPSLFLTTAFTVGVACAAAAVLHTTPCYDGQRQPSSRMGCAMHGHPIPH